MTARTPLAGAEKRREACHSWARHMAGWPGTGATVSLRISKEEKGENEVVLDEGCSWFPMMTIARA